MPAEPRYRAIKSDDMVMAPLDGLVAVYDRRSGQTHLLAAPLPDLLVALGTSDWPIGEFVTHLSDQFIVSGEGDDPTLQIAAHLNELASLGLVAIR